MTLELKLIGKKGNGMVCLVEKDAPPIYQLIPDETDDGVFALDDELVHSVVLDNLYTEGRKRKRLNLPYRRRGRNIEVLVKEPYHVEGFDADFHVVTFKGAGAKSGDDADEKRYVIDPLTWRGGTQVNQHGRIWGSLDKGFAVGEAEEKALSSRNIFHTPYVAQNKLSERVQNEVYKMAGRKQPNVQYWSSNFMMVEREKQSGDPDLWQVARLSMTNIRYEEFAYLIDKEQFAELSLEAGWTLERWINHLATVNGQLVKQALKLASKGKFLAFDPGSGFSDNTYITGEITDLEQVVIKDYEKNDKNEYSVGGEIPVWPTVMMTQNADVLSKLSDIFTKDRDSYLTSYLEKLSEVSGYEFEKNGCEIYPFVFQYLRYRRQQFEKAKERKVRV